MSSENFDKYEYLNGEDLNCKPSTVEQDEFDYTPLGKCFNKELKEEYKKEGLLKRLKNIKGKKKEQLKADEDQGKKQLQVLTEKLNKGVDFKNVSLKNKLSLELIRAYNKIEEQTKKIDYKKLLCNDLGKHHYNFTTFLSLGSFAEVFIMVVFCLNIQKLNKRIWKICS